MSKTLKKFKTDGSIYDLPYNLDNDPLSEFVLPTDVVRSMTTNRSHCGESVTSPRNRRFRITIDTTKTSNGSNSDTAISLPFISYNVGELVIDWGDSNNPAPDVFNHPGGGVTLNPSYTYPTPGIYNIVIEGASNCGIEFGNTGDRNKLISIDEWNSLKVGYEAFYGCENLRINAKVNPPILLSDVENAFRNCTSINLSSSNVNWGAWDVSSVTQAKALFAGSTFNFNISGWDVSNILDMSQMFEDTPFNQRIGYWDVSNVTDMSYMFKGTENFTQNISGWDVSSVTNMIGMFQDSNFNLHIEGWDVSNVTDFTSMFMDNITFTQSLGLWDVSKAEDMNSMFSGATSFEGSIKDWDISLVTDFNNFMLSNNAISISDYDRILENWSSIIQKDLVGTVHFGDNQYSTIGEVFRNNMTEPDYNLDVRDGGLLNPQLVPELLFFQYDNTGFDVNDVSSLEDLNSTSHFETLDEGEMLIGKDITFPNLGRYGFIVKNSLTSSPYRITDSLNTDITSEAFEQVYQNGNSYYISKNLAIPTDVPSIPPVFFKLLIS